MKYKLSLCILNEDNKIIAIEDFGLGWLSSIKDTIIENKKKLNKVTLNKETINIIKYDCIIHQLDRVLTTLLSKIKRSG